MPHSLTSLTRVIHDTPADAASFFSLPYVDALRSCTAYAYAATLHTLTATTKPTSACGDAVADCISRVRLETERRVAGAQRTALLAVHAVLRASDEERRLQPTLELDADTPPAAAAAAAQASASGPGSHHRASSGPHFKSSRRASGRSSSAAGSHTSGHLPGADLANGKRGSEEATLDATGGAASLSSSFSNKPVTVEAAVRLLREGLTRSFGWASPSTVVAVTVGEGDGGHSDLHSSSTALTGLADAVLSRRTYVPRSPDPSSSSAASAAAAPLYMELEDEEGRLNVVLEWVEDVLLFALHQGFSTPQTQALLLDSVLLLRLLKETSAAVVDGDGEEDDGPAWEERVGETLQDVLCTQACPTIARVIEKVRQRQPVVREVPDPVQLAELEQRRLKATTAKALAILDAAQAAIPLVTQTVMEEVEVEVEKDATLPPLFSMAEATAVVDFLTRSTVMHRGLWCWMTCGEGRGSTAPARPSRPVVHVPLCAYVEDVPPVFLPPLTAFHPSRLQGEVDAQRELYDDCVAERERLYAAKFTGPMNAMAAAEGAQRAALIAAATAAAVEDRENALTVEQCAHVEQAFQLRLRDVVLQNARVARSGAGPLALSTPPDSVGERAVDAAAAAAAPPPHSASRTSGPEASTQWSKANVSAHAAATRSSLSASDMMGHSLVSAGVAAAVPLPLGTAFTIADVERRVERIAAASENVPIPGAAGAAGRGGPRKR